MNIISKNIFLFLMFFWLFTSITFITNNEIESDWIIEKGEPAIRNEKFTTYSNSKIDLNILSEVELNISINIAPLSNFSKINTVSFSNFDKKGIDHYLSDQSIVTITFMLSDFNVDYNSTIRYEILIQRIPNLDVIFPLLIQVGFILCSLFYVVERYISRRNLKHSMFMTKLVDKTKFSETPHQLSLSMLHNKANNLPVIIVMPIQLILMFIGDILSLGVISPIQQMVNLSTNQLFIFIYLAIQLFIAFNVFPLKFEQSNYFFTVPLSYSQLWFIRIFHLLVRVIEFNLMLFLSYFVIKYKLILGINYPLKEYVTVIYIFFIISFNLLVLFEIIRMRGYSVEVSSLLILFIVGLIGIFQLNDIIFSYQIFEKITSSGSDFYYSISGLYLVITTILFIVGKRIMEGVNFR